MKSRNELVNEIVQERRDKIECPLYISGVNIDDFLRSALLRISDASMDAVEVEGKYTGGGTKERELIYNSAIAASRKLREDFTKDI